MRYLKGGSVRDSLQDGAYELNAISQFLDQIASALDFAHRNHVIHRDIKPGNILLDEDGNAYLADFGIAKDLTGIVDSKTVADAVVGSLDYISPEQARSEPVTPRTDIYSLGVMLYEMITGEHPFHNTSSIERLYKHINDPLPEIIDLPDTVRDSINEIISKATAKNPKDRYPDVLALAIAFREGSGIETKKDDNIVEQLTLREQEILSLITKNMSNREIAEQLVVTVGTVKWHITQLYKKLGVRSRVQAMVRARELHLIFDGQTNDGLPDSSISSTAISLPEPENPYKGLHAFQMADSRDFFGRDNLTQKLIDQMCDRENAYQRFMAIVGPSGSGKSSLVKAGLIPALWKGAILGSEKWFIVDMIPGTHPIDKLETALIRVAANQTHNLREQLQRDERGLLRVADIILPGDETELVIVVDQFEEVFTLVTDEEVRQQFLDLLETAVRDVRSRVRVMITLRADYYDRPLYYPSFGELLRNRMETLLPLTAKGLDRAIRGPAERVGVIFEQGLVEQIVSTMNYQAGALPLLQYALTELFDRRQGRLLTHDAYQQIGGAVGALANRADDIYLGFTEEARELSHQMFMRLVTLGEGAEDTRRRVSHAELLSLTDNTDLMEEIIDQFAAYRLLSLDHDPETRQPTIEVAHEAILREWKRLRQWLNESRDEIRMQQQLSRMVQEWQDAEQDISYLVGGNRLKELEDWANSTQFIITPGERKFIDISIRQRADERQKLIDQQRLEKLLSRALISVFAIATIIAVGLSVFAFSERNLAIVAQKNSERRADELQSLNLMNSSQQMINEDMKVALRLGLEANNIENPPLRSQQGLHELAAMPGPSQILHGHTAEIDALDYSSDSNYIVSGDRDHNLILWDAQTGQELRHFVGHSRAITTVEISPDSSMILSGSADRRIILWERSTGLIIREYLAHDRDVTRVVFSPDSQTFFSSSVDQSILQWDLQSGQIIRRLQGHLDEVLDIDLSPDGKTLVSGSAGGVSIVWDVETGSRIYEFSPSREITRAVAFSPNGRTVATGSGNSIIFWDLKTGERRKTLVSDYQIWALEFNSNGTQLLSVPWDMTGFEGAVTVWNVFSGRAIHHLHSGTFDTAATFSPDDTELVSASGDRTLIQWDLQPIKPVLILDSYKNGALSVAVSPDGTKILSGGGQGGLAGGQLKDTGDPEFMDSRVILWDIASGEILNQLHGHEGSVWNVAFSPDGKVAASAGSDQNIIIWDIASGQIQHQFQAHTGAVFSIDFSTDGQKLVSASADTTLILWNTQTGDAIQRFEGHKVPVYNVVFTQDDQSIISISNDGEIIVWDIQTGKKHQQFQSSAQMPRQLTQLSDQNIVISSGYMESDPLQFWNLETGELEREIVLHGNAVTASVDQSLLALTKRNGGTFTLLDMVSGEILQETKAHHDVVWDVAFTPDSNYLLTASGDGTVKKWAVSLEKTIDWLTDNRVIPPLTAEQRLRFKLGDQ